MKRIYKILIAVCVMVSVLLCCCFSVGAARYESQFIGDSSKISYFRYTDINGEEYHVDNFQWSWNGSRFSTWFTSPGASSNIDIYNVLIAMEPDEDFIYYLDKQKYYTFSFYAGMVGGSATLVPFSNIAVALKDSSGNISVSTNSSLYTSGSDHKWYSVTFSPEQLKKIDNISLVQFQYVFDPPVASNNTFFRFDFNSNILITETYPAVDEITGAISDSTDKITGGWTPAPDVPEGSESVGELDSIEQELQSSSEEGISAGLSMITSIPDTIFKFRPGLMFFISMSNEIMQIEWLTTLLTIGLSIGIVAFLLNISGSIFSKVSRDNAKRSSGSNNKKSG